VLEHDDPGLECGAPMRKMGRRAIRDAELFLQDVEVGADRRLGGKGQGFRGLTETFDRSRVTLAASATSRRSRRGRRTSSASRSRER
jgi:alkylation response protein AidB-like acyl-CoA dehydrogenase